MVIEPKPGKNRNAHSRQVLRGGAALLVVALLLGGLLSSLDTPGEQASGLEKSSA